MNDLPLHFIFIFFILGMFLFFSVLIYLEKMGWTFSKHPDRAGELFEDKQTLTAAFEGKEYQYIYDSGRGEGLSNHFKRLHAPLFLIKVNCVTSVNFRIVKENRMDVFLKMMGMFREVQTGDVGFDKKFYIHSDFPDFASSFFKEVKNRRVIEEIFRIGFTELEHDGSVIEARWKPFIITGDFDQLCVEKAGGHLVSLTEEMPETFEETLEPGISHLRTQRKVTVLLSAILGIISPALYLYGEERYQPLEQGLFDISLKYGLSLFALFAGYVLFLFKGSSSSYRTLLRLLAISLVGFLLSGYALVTIINGAADTGKMIVNTVKVIEKVESRSKYYVHVKSWRSDTIRLNVSYETYNIVQPYLTRFNVYTKPGRLGFEWLAGWEVYQPKDKWDV